MTAILLADVYLQIAPDRIIGDMDQEINNFNSGDSDKSECFAEPPTNTNII